MRFYEAGIDSHAKQMAIKPSQPAVSLRIKVVINYSNYIHLVSPGTSDSGEVAAVLTKKKQKEEG